VPMLQMTPWCSGWTGESRSALRWQHPAEAHLTSEMPDQQLHDAQLLCTPAAAWAQAPPDLTRLTDPHALTDCQTPRHTATTPMYILPPLAYCVTLTALDSMEWESTYGRDNGDECKSVF
jgi:hypothetical protein